MTECKNNQCSLTVKSNRNPVFRRNLFYPLNYRTFLVAAKLHFLEDIYNHQSLVKGKLGNSN